MNSAKKIMNQQNDDNKKGAKSASAAKGTSQLSDGGVSDTRKIVTAAICILIVLVLCIGVGVQQLSPKVVLTINNTKYTLNDMMYPIYERESMYLPYNAMYEAYTGNSVWDSSYMGDDRNVDASATNSIGLKQEIINAETQYYILYEEAKKAGYTLDDDDKKDVEDKVNEALKGLSWSQKMKLNISKSKLTKRYEKRVLADKYQKDQVNALDASVDEKEAIKDVSKKDYREYKLEYYTASTTKVGKDDKVQDLSAKDKKTLLERMEELADKAAKEKDFSKLLDEDKDKDKKEDKDDADAKEDTDNEEDTDGTDEEDEITFSEDSFIEQDGWSLISDKSILKKIKNMKNDEISQVFEDKDNKRYILVKMVDNNSTDSYEEACDDAIEEAKNAAYDEWYQGIMANYTVETVSENWDDIVIGTVTTDIVTAEDLEKMAAEGSSEDATSAQ